MTSLDFSSFSKLVKAGDKFKMRNTKTPGLDAREGGIISCVGNPLECFDRAMQKREMVIPILYPSGMPYHSGRVGALTSSSCENVVFDILDVDE